MPVTGLSHVALEVPDIHAGVAFYTKAGLTADVHGDTAYLRCKQQDRPSIMLFGGAQHDRKRLHHITLFAEDLAGIAARVPDHGGRLVDPAIDDGKGLWVEDPHGLLVRLVDCPAGGETVLRPAAPFEINAPGRIIRTRRSAIRPRHSYPAAEPLRLGHVMLFSPDVLRSVAFFTEALGLGLADHAGDVVAFTCARRDSEHHLIAFAKSPGVGFHHASFQLHDPDAVGRAGRALLDATGRGAWGFGRHTIGSNFFHYIQDPWGSWFEYYADMDYIDDHALWTPTDYGLEDSLASWGPDLPHDFVHNYEVGAETFG